MSSEESGKRADSSMGDKLVIPIIVAIAVAIPSSLLSYWTSTNTSKETIRNETRKQHADAQRQHLVSLMEIAYQEVNTSRIFWDQRRVKAKSGKLPRTNSSKGLALKYFEVAQKSAIIGLSVDDDRIPPLIDQLVAHTHTVVMDQDESKVRKAYYSAGNVLKDLKRLVREDLRKLATIEV
jgi:hypothetical protein